MVIREILFIQERNIVLPSYLDKTKAKDGSELSILLCSLQKLGNEAKAYNFESLICAYDSDLDAMKI